MLKIAEIRVYELTAHRYLNSSDFESLIYHFYKIFSTACKEDKIAYLMFCYFRM